MASITFSGQLDQAMNEAAAEGNKILFIPQQTVGEVLPGAASELVVESDGSYSITLAYNTYSIYHYSDVTKKKTLIANNVVVSADTAVSTIPDLIGSTVPVTEDGVLTIQGYLTNAQDSATAAATSASNAAASEAAVTNRIASYEVESTEYLINTFDSSNMSTGEIVHTLGYYTAGDGGGADWVKTGETGTANQSPNNTALSTIYDSQGNEFEMIKVHSNTSLSYGVDDSDTDYSSALQAVITDCESRKNPVTIADENITQVPTVDHLGNVVFVGSGSIPGGNYDSGFYRKSVITELTQRGVPAKDFGMNLDLTLDNVTIVLTGDSLTTYNGNGIGSPVSLSTFLINKLKQDNPDIDIDFYNRGIGGKTYIDLDGTPSGVDNSAYPWYTDTSMPWMDYIEDVSPDYVFVSLGMNDVGTFDPVNLQSVISKIEAMGAKPVLISNMVPNLSANDTYSNYSSFRGQELRDMVAGYVRTYADYNGIPLIDINRTFNMVRDGRDVVTSYLTQTDYVTNDSASMFEADESLSCRDFLIKANVESGCFDVSSGSGIFSVSLFYSDPEGISTNVVFIDDNNGYLRFRFYDADGTGAPYLNETTDITTPTGDSMVEISIVGNVFGFRVLNSDVSTSNGIQPKTWKVIRYGGVFQPRVSYTGGTSGPILGYQFAYGTDIKYKPLLTDYDMFGDTDDATARSYTGANGINHPTSLGISTVYGEHFKRQDYTFNRVPYTYIDGNDRYTLYPDGQLKMSSVITFSSGSAITAGSMYRSDNVFWTFPYSPTKITSVSYHAENANVWCSGNPTVSSGVAIRLNSSVEVSSSVNVKVEAFGAWK